MLDCYINAYCLLLTDEIKYTIFLALWPHSKMTEGKYYKKLLTLNKQKRKTDNSKRNGRQITMKKLVYVTNLKNDSFTTIKHLVNNHHDLGHTSVGGKKVLIYLLAVKKKNFFKLSFL